MKIKVKGLTLQHWVLCPGPHELWCVCICAFICIVFTLNQKFIQFLWKLHEIWKIILTLHTCVLCLFSHIELFAALWTWACQAPLSMWSSRQEYWSGLPFPSSRDLPDPRIASESPVAPLSQADSLPLSHHGSPSYKRLWYHNKIW